MGKVALWQLYPLAGKVVLMTPGLLAATPNQENGVTRKLSQSERAGENPPDLERGKLARRRLFVYKRRLHGHGAILAGHIGAHLFLQALGFFFLRLVQFSLAFRKIVIGFGQGLFLF